MRRILLLVVLVVLVAAGWLSWQQYTRLREPFRAFPGDEQFVDIAPGAGPQAIGRVLVEAGVVRDPITWRLALWRTGGATRLKAGEYRFTRPQTPDEVVARLVRGDVYLRAITFREGLTIRQMAELYERSMFGPAGDFTEASRQVDLIRDLDPAAPNLEGYLFPDTYALPRRASATDLAKAMVTRFERVWTADLRQEAAASGMSLREIVTLASLVEKETGKADERPIIAGVFRNRLSARIRLQCDPTVIYALERRGGFDGDLTRADLSLDSPYNTYKYAGLPPGPIAAPGRASLEAAVHPADVTYLYFVSRNDGSHAFATTLEEHNRNVYIYQVQHSRQQHEVGTDDRGRAPAVPRAGRH